MKLKSKIKDIKGRIKRVIIWIPILCEDEDWDYAYMYKILATKLKSMEVDSLIWATTSAPNDRKRIKMSRILCERLADEMFYYQDTYAKNLGVVSHIRKNYDLELLCETLRKYSLGWWD